MGKRSDRRIFRKRRQRAGFVLLVSVAIVVVGAIMFSSLSPFSPDLVASGGEEASPVNRVESPEVDRAPEAVAENAGASRETVDEPAVEEKAAEEEKAQAESSGNGGENAGDKEQAQKEPEQQASGPPPIPKPATNDLWMDIPALGLDDNYVANTDSHAAMDAGAIKLPSSGFPWQENANTYIAAHRLGWPGTASDYQFYDLVNMQLGDKIYLYDANGTVYTYEVSGFAEVLPSETWVTSPQAGRDMISLQTCIEDYGDYWTMGPNWYVRYVVQADRVSVDRA
ncbi:sortase [Rubrobacter tropicus]|uniref:Sortase n=1 Tax=Rubrobacter tropicus TaxID=2653851 RepID=A0A6G8Q8A0_9ACTN|nr:sortase [Rubrobacter tropicus]QIN82673.1 sortase [Rubrobacter tropicus]